MLQHSLCSSFFFSIKTFFFKVKACDFNLDVIEGRAPSAATMSSCIAVSVDSAFFFVLVLLWEPEPLEVFFVTNVVGMGAWRIQVLIN